MRKKIVSPVDLMALNMRNARMMSQAGMIIGMRMMGMAGLWRVTPSENARMVEEKTAAAREGAIAAAFAVMRGASPAAVVDTALKPVRKRTAANVKRLAKRGPGKPT